MIHERLYKRGEIVTLDELHKAVHRKKKERLEPKKIISDAHKPDAGIGNIDVDVSKADVPVKAFIRTRRGHMEHVDPFYRHQLKLARDTLAMPQAMAGVMGGMSKEEAQAFMDKHNEMKRKRARAGRRAREDAYRSVGLKKVKGALGGTYWE